MTAGSYDIDSEPLAPRCKLIGRSLTSHPRGGLSTALWRGYSGAWEIADGRQYLVGLDVSLVDQDDLAVASLFPEHSKRVFADWCTGNLSLSRGEAICAYPTGHDIHERDLILELDSGVVTRSRERHNTAPGHCRVPPKTPPRRRR